jgi:hypothetical protein
MDTGSACPPVKKFKQSALSFNSSKTVTAAASSVSVTEQSPQTVTAVTALSASSGALPDSNETENDNVIVACSTDISDNIKTDVGICFKPHQPKNKQLPAKQYSGVNRRFQAAYFSSYTWLHWSDSNECVYCHPCRNISILGIKLLCASTSGDNAFSTNGYQSWKTPRLDFKKHGVITVEICAHVRIHVCLCVQCKRCVKHFVIKHFVGLCFTSTSRLQAC